ncbi:hypothetical protein [Streptomyces sp. NPDC003943]
MDAEERRYAADLIEDDRKHRILRGAADWAEQQEGDGRTVPVGYERWAAENWTGDDHAAAFEAWLRANGRAAEPGFAWAVSGPVDRVEQSGARLDMARAAVQAAREGHAAAQRSMSREGIRRTREQLDVAHVALADAEREHAAERAVSAKGKVGEGASDAGVRYGFGLLDGRGRRAVLVGGLLAVYVSQPFLGDWYAYPLHGRVTAHPDGESALEALVEWAERRAVEDRERVWQERADAARAVVTESVTTEVAGAGTAGVAGVAGTAGRSVAQATRAGGAGYFRRSTFVTGVHVTGHVTGCVTVVRPLAAGAWGRRSRGRGAGMSAVPVTQTKKLYKLRRAVTPRWPPGGGAPGGHPALRVRLEGTEATKKLYKLR